MSDTTTGTALHSNSSVAELMAILESGGRTEQARDFRELLDHVGGMERQLDAAAKEITAMRRELAELRDLHGEPLHTTAKQTIDSAHRNIKQLQEHVGVMKDAIVQGAKDAVAAVKEKGIAALSGALSFLGARSNLESMRENLDKNTKSCDRSLARVENISRQYHEVGTATRNLGRAILGREAKDDTKQMGRLAKLAAAPMHATKKLYTGMAKGVDAALGRLEKLEQAAKKPSMLENLQAMKEASAKEQGMALSPSKAKEPSL